MIVDSLWLAARLQVLQEFHVEFRRGIWFHHFFGGTRNSAWSQPATWLAGLQEFHEGMIFISMTENWVKVRVDPFSGASQQIFIVDACNSSLHVCVAGIFHVGKDVWHSLLCLQVQLLLNEPWSSLFRQILHGILWEQWCNWQSNVFTPPIPWWNSTSGIPPWNAGIWWNCGIDPNSTKEFKFHLEFLAELEFQWNGGIVEFGAKVVVSFLRRFPRWTILVLVLLALRQVAPHTP